MRGATEIIATSPTGTIVYFEGHNLRVGVKAGSGHWTIHEALHENTPMALVGVIPKEWGLKLVLP